MFYEINSGSQILFLTYLSIYASFPLIFPSSILLPHPLPRRLDSFPNLIIYLPLKHSLFVSSFPFLSSLIHSTPTSPIHYSPRPEIPLRITQQMQINPSRNPAQEEPRRHNSVPGVRERFLHRHQRQIQTVSQQMDAEDHCGRIGRDEVREEVYNRVVVVSR